MQPVKSLTNLPKWLNIGLAFPVILLNGWLLIQFINYFQPLVSVISVAILLAFVLDYPIQLLQKRGVPRILAVVVVLLLSIIILGAVGVILLPLILEQLNELANLLPYWIESATQQIEALQNWAATQQLPVNLSGLAGEILGKISSQLQSFTGKILGFAFDTIGNLLNLLITIVLTIYLVLNGESLWNGIYLWFPPETAKKVRELLREDFNNYFIGQATLGAILAVSITLAFVVLRVPLSLLFGIGIGLFSLFPFGTGIGIGIVSLLITLKDFGLGLEVAAIGVAIDQINSNIIAPRILGNLTGLNPVWVVISLLIGAKLGGVLGLLVAIPLASFIKDIADTWRNGKFNKTAVDSE
ncbi:MULTISPECIES: AI-2E family transporter [Aphanizomenonaceae]|uniref:AI-2E family transporter n=1 Tax=Dolichospermum heterosporum TAC447 TaxID=747523 RepID=A0ABY5LRH3_9CYAN|nr:MULTISPECIES: AI-2E family transporter [Aphanizomenonaceae]MBE9256092.1 AI-2E family transporter [Dolichospermum sp. LEGE 00246]MDK2408730.1 AI-2E family transporter [Aphanizomenon sp. 202]MDK2458222.1 AI-2E family transporter [Aphanizomenon sp. PH219]UUO13305.1 AI-2E family transporter [Dolichospermum heterosporum TAC447]